MNYTYLIINLLVVLPILYLGFDKRVGYFNNIKALIITTIICATPFILWDYSFTSNGIWSFNEDYITGFKIYGLPIEEILFFFTIPFSSIFIYEVAQYYVKHYKIEEKLKSRKLVRPSILVYIFLIIAMAIFAFEFPQLRYTSTVAIVTICITIYLMVLGKYKELSFNLYLLISFLPFLIVNGFLTGIPVVEYNSSEIIGLRILYIPFEDFLFSFSMLVLYTIVYSTFKSIFSHHSRVELRDMVKGQMSQKRILKQ